MGNVSSPYPHTLGYPDSQVGFLAPQAKAHIVCRRKGLCSLGDLMCPPSACHLSGWGFGHLIELLSCFMS